MSAKPGRKSITLGAFLDNLIWVSGHNQTEVADAIDGLSRSHLSNICNGVDALLPGKTADDLCRFLGIKSNRLLSLESENKRKERRKREQRKKRNARRKASR